MKILFGTFLLIGLIGCGKDEPSPQFVAPNIQFQTCKIVKEEERILEKCPNGEVNDLTDILKGDKGDVGETGAIGSIGPIGETGVAGENGSDGKSSKETVVTLVVDRTLVPWDFNNKITLDRDGVMLLPQTFLVNALPQVETTGWLDFKVGDQIYCYQGINNTKTYSFKYKKIAGVTSACDLNNDIDVDAVSNFANFQANDVFQIIPRSTRFVGVISFKIPAIIIE